MEKSVRQTAFLFLCFPLRFLLAYIAHCIELKYLPYFGVLIGTMAVSMLYLYFSNNRLRAPEGGGVTWWKDLRLLHGSLLLCAAIYAFQESRYATIPLVIDPMVGLVAFLHKHYIKK